MIEKYYTPSIEEFHVGFEYYLQDLHDNLVDKTYRPCIVEDTDDLKTIEVNFFPHDTRVKHLDQEDIESLEFELFESSKKEAIYHRSSDSIMTKHEVHIWVDKEFGWIEIKDMKDKHDLHPMFRGMIKNKSELKKVLEMIGYEADNN